MPCITDPDSRYQTDHRMQPDPTFAVPTCTPRLLLSSESKASMRALVTTISSSEIVRESQRFSRLLSPSLLLMKHEYTSSGDHGPDTYSEQKRWQSERGFL